MSVKKGVSKKEIIQYLESEDLMIPADEEHRTSLKELRDLVAATNHLPEDTIVEFDEGYSDDNGYEYHYIVRTGQSWKDLMDRWVKENGGEPVDFENCEKAILEPLGLIQPEALGINSMNSFS